MNNSMSKHHLNIWAFIEQVLDNILNVKIRSLLTILGIMVGTASVVALLSGGDLATENALVQFKQLGTDLLSVNFESSGSGENKSKVTLQNVRQLELSMAETKHVSSYINFYAPLSFQGIELDGEAVGLTHSLQDIAKIKLATGRFIAHQDQEVGYTAYFCVLGDKIVQQIRHAGIIAPLVGKQINIGSDVFTIIGTIKPQQENLFIQADLNNAVMIPIQAMLQINKDAQVNNVVITLRPNSDIELAKRHVTAAVNLFMPSARLFFRSSQEVIKSMNEQHRTFTWMLGFIGGISLLVGGVGVMNIMLVSVTERRCEIGIRRAVGARRKDIRYMFLLEALGLSILGGICGVLLGMIATYIIAYFAHWAFVILPTPIVLGFFVSALTGVFFGFYPAFKASNLRPIEALRSE